MVIFNYIQQSHARLDFKFKLNKNIKNLQNNFIIKYVDKAPNNYALICKSYYHQLIDTILTSNNNFMLTNYSNVFKK